MIIFLKHLLHALLKDGTIPLVGALVLWVKFILATIQANCRNEHLPEVIVTLVRYPVGKQFEDGLVDLQLEALPVQVVVYGDVQAELLVPIADGKALLVFQVLDVERTLVLIQRRLQNLRTLIIGDDKRLKLGVNSHIEIGRLNSAGIVVADADSVGF